MSTMVTPPARQGERLVPLADGREASNYSPEWRLECLARYVLAIQGLDARRAWLADHEKRAGKAAADELKARMSELHRQALPA